MSAELTTETSFTLVEEQVRRSWRRNDIVKAVRTKCVGGPKCTIHQEPLLVVEEAWADNVQLLAVADSLARYHTMQGSEVQVHTGWTCHGLPLEVAVEQALGDDIASYDLAGFNAACRHAADEGMQQTQALCAWLGVWLEQANLYTTMSRTAISKVWAAIEHLWRAGRLRREHRVVPSCPRCVTPLSEAEATRKSVNVEVRSLWLRLPWDGQPGAYLLTWTPDPLMLVGMVALAVHPNASYVVVETEGSEGEPPVRLLLAEAAMERTLQRKHQVVHRLKGKALRDTQYHPPFTFLPVLEGTGRIVCSEAVSMDRGTGLQPVSPAFDGPSLAIARDLGLPAIEQPDSAGGLDNAAAPWRGLSPLESEPIIVETLQERGLLLRVEPREQAWALCPHCETPLLPQARQVWLFDTGSGSWVVGRDRAWGTSLPVWTCSGCAEQVCISSLNDLAAKTGTEVGHIEPHRPDIDKLVFPCSACGGTMHREADVVDAAFEAAVLPWASPSALGSPVPPGAASNLGPGHTSSQTLAVGLGDKHLGWLGDIIEMAALLRGALAWEQAVALPESEPGALLDVGHAPSADVLRWAAISGTTPARANIAVLRPLWELAFMPSTPAPYADAETGRTSPGSEARQKIASGILRDRWLAARLHQTIASMTEAMQACEPQQAARQLSLFIDDITNWHAPDQHKRRVEVLDTLSRLLAPFVPHLAEAIFRRVNGRDANSVHLAGWPVADPARIDDRILADMGVVRHLATLGQAARAQAGIETGQLLSQALFISEGMTAPSQWQPLVAQALGVSKAQAATSLTEHCTWRLTLADTRAAGRGVSSEQIEAALVALAPEDSAALMAQLWEGLSVGLDVQNQVVTLLPDEVTAIPQPGTGWVAAAGKGCVVILAVD